MTGRSRFARAAAACALAAALALQGCVTRSGGGAASKGGRVRIGPFFEWRESPDGSVFWAARPFWSREISAGRKTDEQDFLWPLATRHASQGGMWWRALNMWGSADAATPEYFFAFFPLWHQGATREGKFHCGLFPVYGEHPHFLFMDNIRYALFPAFLSYDVKGEPRQYVLWPVFSAVPSRGSAGVWPLAGRSRLRESTHWYMLWPVFTWAYYDADRDTPGAGKSWMVWPLCGAVDRERETQYMFLPPFFGYVRTPYAKRWRMPWPLFERHRSGYKDSWHFWPFAYLSGLRSYDAGMDYAAFDAKKEAGELPEPETVTRHYIWWLVTDERTKTAKRRSESFRIFPFWASERTYATEPDGTERMVSSYRRLWPFWSSETENGVNRQRALEPVPIRHVPAIDRNWAPFWTLWDCRDTEDGGTLHTWLWGIIKYTTGGRD